AASSLTERPSSTCASTRYRAFSTGELPSFGVSYVLTQVSPMWWNRTPPSPLTRRTKIIATVGPASRDGSVLERLIEAGADVLRLNFSHADAEWHAGAVDAIRAAAARAGREVAILGDTDGPDDLEWVDFAVEHEIDLLAISFVSSVADVERAAERLRALRSDIPLIAKIEKPEAAEAAEEIVRAASSGIMVARGDLGEQLPLAQVPVVQKRLIRAAGKQSKPSITATQMLASMVTAPRPTRAEVTDVANAIYDGTDAVMLSEETAIGHHPVEAVRVMDQIALATEPDLRYGEWLFTRTDQATQDVADSVAQGAVGAVYRLGLKALLVPTTSGRTARLVSAHRPKVPVLAISPRIETVRRLGLLFGVTAVLSDYETEVRGLLDGCAEIAARHGIAESGDLIAITAGLPEQELGTNLFEVHRVP
ncbi:MAG TPA: pyruvate kinase, partial [Solirubrobacterales bacterium]|nr:pyruvate kinase [Solirubrobacterales bacterium]